MESKPKDLLVCIPTYNERDNIAQTLEEVLAAIDCDILVVDDASPDGTGDFVRVFSSRNPRVHLLSRPAKEGLGRAYVAAFDWGLAQGYNGFIQFDADGSHRAAHLPAMAERLRHKPFITGSRQVEGGGSTGWSFTRRGLSCGGNLYARTLLRVPVRDMTGGFNGVRREVLDAIDYRRLRANGYAFQMELKYRVIRAGYEIEEIPITFHARRAGRSKMSPRIIGEALVSVLRLGLDL